MTTNFIRRKSDTKQTLIELNCILLAGYQRVNWLWLSVLAAMISAFVVGKYIPAYTQAHERERERVIEV